MEPAALVLASASPRRRMLLSKAGFRFEVQAAGVEETVFDGEHPIVATCRIADEKAAAVVRTCTAERVVLAADTSVICGGRMFGKPVSIQDACEQLEALAGRNHRVVTAWTVRRSGRSAPDLSPQSAGGYSCSIVRLRELDRKQIRAYVALGESGDKAGAYALQGAGGDLVGAVVGPEDNVVGLPMAQVVPILGRFGVSPCR